MPKFLDLFVGEIRKKRERLKESLEKGRASSLDDDFKALLVQNWHPLPDGEIGDLHLVAVDGSRGLREYANGSRFYVVRAFGLSNEGERFRTLETEAFLARGSEEDIGRYIRQKTEFVEMELALKAIPHLRGPRKLILIDGSLYGRMMHLIRDCPVEGDRGFLLRYMDVYSRLLEACRREGVALVGVGKDSRAEFVRNEFLNQLFLSELRSLGSSVSLQEIKELEKCVAKIDGRPGVCFEILAKLKEKYGALLDRFEEMMIERVHSRPDSQLVLNFAPGPDYCSPVELAATKQLREDLPRMAKNPEWYVRRSFKNSLIENRYKKDEFLKYAVNVIQKVLKFPTVVSFHLLLDRRDTPLRIDIPSWVLGSENTLNTLEKNRLLKDVDDDLEELICMLRSGYAGLMDYNVWLKRADEEVKLRRKDMDALYERVLEKELGVTLVHTRGYRRVKYP
ncbi:TPA: DNA double-strand break repair nuclease NurA [Candidatus Bathyarchaeota archaeon]|nr:DNA double-strand break repair nuclease NurA [Candidatus Bathyarchaeota archaeon]